MGKRILRIVIRTIFYVIISTGLLFCVVGFSIGVGMIIVPQNLVIGSILATIILAVVTAGIYLLGKLLFRFLWWLNDES